ncbi:MAG: type I glyceraldehyde-3-phosphate dehydrogenase [Bdellovibrionales bacterium CG10_big_fil_rev_8_21_14_0_10_45_34]|nr:MAG: type I glyceraldehyde-3-phosphate dehydrogenase [Bdellovibrionales bacterium CG10_big_fil_rev_8_21_14_0_10_45_34]
MAKPRVGISGFGRIGRILFRVAHEELDIVGINDLSDAQTMAHLLKYDSTHGQFKGEVTFDESSLTVNGKRIPVSKCKNPAEIPWKNWEVDLVLECSGAFKNKEDFTKHIDAGAKRVLVSAPAEGADLTIVYGVNHTEYNPAKHTVISNASCTTNCLAPLAKVLHEKFEIERGFMTTVHSYTNDQRILDAGHKDLRRARSAAVSMIPTTTGAAKAVGMVLPALKGKIDGTSIRVPTPNVSVVDFVANTKKSVAAAAINSALTEAANGELKGVLAVEKAPLVSCDYIGNPYSSIVDLPSTMVCGENMFKVFSWYDNEMGFSYRMVDFAKYMAQKGL